MTAYTTRAKLEAYWSQYGVDVRLDDGADGEVSVAEESQLDTIISHASAIVGSWLSRRYSSLAIGGANPPTTTPASVEFMTNVIACYRLGRRRDNPVSEALAEDYRTVMEWLKALAENAGDLIDVSDGGNDAPFMSNVRIDGSFPRSVVRVVTTTSVGGAPASGVLRAAEYNWFYWR